MISEAPPPRYNPSPKSCNPKYPRSGVLCAAIQDNMEKKHIDSHTHEAKSGGSCCASGEHAALPPMPAIGKGKVKDLVCGMDVDPKTATHSSEHAGHTYYFCSAGCKAKFEVDPAQYLPVAGSAGQKVRDPVCGMDVDP